MRVAGCHLGEWLYLPICRDSGRGHHRRPLKNRESTRLRSLVVEGNGEKPPRPARKGDEKERESGVEEK